MSATMTIELSKTVSNKQNPTHIPSDTNPSHAPHAKSPLSPPIIVETKGIATIVITNIAGVTVISSLISGLVVISLPAMGRDLNIPQTLLLWPASIYSLTCGCTLMLCGALADVIGARTMYLWGTFLQTVFTLACGLARTSTQLIVFRALAGVAISFCLPSAVSLITHYFPSGRRRNLAFGTMGGGQPLGFTIGLVMGGFLVDSVGWPVGLYIAAGLNAILFVFAFFGLPVVAQRTPLSWTRLRTEIDWIGAFILSSSLALLLYVFATWTGQISQIKSAESISCLLVGLALLPTFTIWVQRQEKRGNVVLMRNSLWRNKAFTSICINVFLVWGSFNATEIFITFLFQDVHQLSATAASIRFLPEPVTGTVANILIGLYVHRVRANWTLIASFIVSAISPLLLAVMRRNVSYWDFEFPAVALLPISCDVLYTISQLIITAEFDENTQALAGGVFNTVAQIGRSMGIALSAVIASTITAQAASHEDSLLTGYRAAWWFSFSAMIACVLVTVWGLHNVGKVGLKRE